MPDRTLIVFFTKGGATELYARNVAEVLESQGHEVAVLDMRRAGNPDLADYDMVIAGTGVRIGMVYWKARRFLKNKALRGKPLAIFLASGIAVEDAQRAREKSLDPLIRRFGLHPVMYEAFPGRLPGPAAKLQDTTDVTRVREWATELSGKIEERRAQAD